MQDNFSDDTKRNFEKGKIFEKYVYDNLYPYSHYDLLSVSPEYNNRFIYDNLMPQLKLRRKESTTAFWVECEFKSDLKTNYILFNKDQIERYKKLSKPITYILGFGGTPDDPKIVFSIPIYEVLPKMEVSDLERYIFNSPLKIQKDSGEWSLKVKKISR